MDKGQNPETQLRELREYCGRRKWEFEIYSDTGWSGTTKSRPQLDRLWADCRRRKCDVVVVYRFDRFARSMKELINTLDEFNRLGIQFVSLHENIDTNSSQGKLMFGIFAAIAEFERELIRERVISGIARARAQGKTLGRRRTVANLDRIDSLRGQDKSWKAIGTELGITADTARRRFLEAHGRAKTPEKRPR